VDYYWQDDSQARIYNSPIDRIESWDNVNAQITLAPEDYRWYFKVFVQNLNDPDGTATLWRCIRHQFRIRKAERRKTGLLARFFCALNCDRDPAETR
jgi:hypothetical protein